MVRKVACSSQCAELGVQYGQGCLLECELPMYTMVKKLSNITLINDSKTLGAHFENFWRNSRGPRDIRSAFALQDRVRLCNCAYAARALSTCPCYPQEAWTKVVLDL